ncbi:SGNH/GDSL hydrolase family protein [Methanobacterium sp.]|uniref:SGNH/GDSL hydrolase family protein n=1 Tax=Methanobacterium sp. TaxID=2164 RepID=UPI003C78A1EF
MKTILCYGDSLTWGYDPATGKRIAIDKRWPGVLRNNLGKNYFVIEEGLNGRTTLWDDPLHGGYKNGMKYLIPCLASHRPVDLVILFLGTNDLKTRFSLSAAEIARSIRVLADIVVKSEAGHHENAPELLLVAPPLITELSNFAEEFESGKAKSHLLGQYYKQVAEEYDIHFFDASEVVTASDLDGIHLDSDEHIKLGHVITDKVKKILR